jgi:hypothetical protein
VLQEEVNGRQLEDKMRNMAIKIAAV